jgi:hypothetical protein
MLSELSVELRPNRANLVIRSYEHVLRRRSAAQQSASGHGAQRGGSRGTSHELAAGDSRSHGLHLGIEPGGGKLMADAPAFSSRVTLVFVGHQ